MKCIQGCDWKTEGQRSLGRYKWEDNIKMDLKERG
jgi:hypothetical protein